MSRIIRSNTEIQDISTINDYLEASMDNLEKLQNNYSSQLTQAGYERLISVRNHLRRLLSTVQTEYATKFESERR